MDHVGGLTADIRLSLFRTLSLVIDTPVAQHVGRLQSRSRNLHVGIQEPALSLASLMPSGLSTLQCRRRRTLQSS